MGKMLLLHFEKASAALTIKGSFSLLLSIFFYLMSHFLSLSCGLDFLKSSYSSSSQLSLSHTLSLFLSASVRINTSHPPRFFVFHLTFPLSLTLSHPLSNSEERHTRGYRIQPISYSLNFPSHDANGFSVIPLLKLFPRL